MKILIGYLVTFTYLLFLLKIVEHLYKIKKLKNETSRKIVHIFSSLAIIPLTIYLYPTIHFVALPAIMILINIVIKQSHIIEGINRKEDDTYGTIFYPLSMTIMATMSIIDRNFLIPYIVGLLTMSLADGLAGLIGSKINKYKKTKQGSTTFFLVTLTIILTANIFYKLNIKTIYILSLALLVTIIELISKKGTDNLTVPLTTSFLLYMII